MLERTPASESRTSIQDTRKHFSLFAGMGHGIFLAPTVVILLLINLFPILYQLFISFTNYRLSSGVRGLIWLTHYIEIFSDERFWNAVAVTGKFSLAALVLEILLGLLIALILDRIDSNLRNLILPLLILPMVMSPVVVGYMWQFMYSQEYGIFTYILRWIGISLSAPPLATVKTVVYAIALVDVWQWTPLVILIVLAGLQSVPIEVYEAAIVDGASRFNLLRYITLPLIRTELVVALLLRMLDAFKVFDIIFAMTGGGPANTSESLSIYLYRVVFKFVKMDYGAAMSILFLIVVTIITKILVNQLVAQREQIF